MGQTGSTGPTFVDITKIYDKKGHNPLHFAASQNTLDAVKCLCNYVWKFGDGSFLDKNDEESAH